MSKTIWIRSAVAASLAIALFTTTSMVALATPGNQPLMADLTVSGTSTNGEAPSVSVNGERAFSGRTVQTATTVTTPATSSAVINLGKLGRVELAPNSSLVLNFTEKAISGNLLSGKIRVIGAADTEANIQTKDSEVVADKGGNKAFAVNADDNATNVTTENGSVLLNSGGKSLKVNAGETKSSNQQDNNAGDIVPGTVVLYAIILGAAAATLIYIAVKGTNDVSVGNSATVTTSPTR